MGASLPGLRAIVVVSAHWQQAPVTLGTPVGAAKRHTLLYDFSGFPERLYHVKYFPPAHLELTHQLHRLLSGKTAVQERERGLDHGVWAPLVHLAPRAKVAVLEVSLPSSLGSEALFELGRMLAPLRKTGVFILGSGNLVHNLAHIDPTEQKPPETWATEFDDWVAGVLQRKDYDALVDYRRRAPAVEMAHPTPEHFLPILVAAGAASVDSSESRTICEGFEYGNISRRSVQFG